jgi:general stress protein CsbA
MKKVLVAVAVVAFFASCKKDYTCTCSIFGISTVVDYNGLNKSDADAAETDCTTGGLCTWAEK